MKASFRGAERRNRYGFERVWRSLFARRTSGCSLAGVKPRFLALALVPILSLFACASRAQELVIPLWPEGVPVAMRADAPAAKGSIGPEQTDARGWITRISEPRLTVVAPAVDRANGTSVVICPGGGYSGLSNQREGIQYAQWLSTLGVTSFILTNRVGDYGHPAPLQDVLRAVRIVRSRAEEFKINPERIGVMGSSAGGHLAASAGTLFDHADGKTGHALDAISARPDFLILMYAVITMNPDVGHAGSRQQLLGEAPAADLVARMSVENSVTAATPPTLLVHTQQDTLVPIENSLRFFQALTKAGVPAELLAFERGSHGLGLRGGLGTSSLWPARAEEWLRYRGLLERAR